MRTFPTEDSVSNSAQHFFPQLTNWAIFLPSSRVRQFEEQMWEENEDGVSYLCYLKRSYPGMYSECGNECSCRRLILEEALEDSLKRRTL